MGCKRRWRREKYIPIDVVEEILMRLPVKDVLRCKSLSKTYYALITNPRFVKKHLPFCSRSNKTKIITVIGKQSQGARTYSLCSVESSSLSEVYAPTPAKTTKSTAYKFLVGSSKGLVCAVFDPWQAEKATIEVWNPATREHKTIHHSPNPDPNINYLGFGYDSASEDHKIVIIFTSLHNPRVQWWSMETNDWREIKIRTAPELVIAPPIITHRTGLFIRGKLYWLASIRNNNNNHVSVGQSCLLTWLITVSALKLQCRMLFDFMGSIALSACGYNNYHVEIDIWVMNDCNKTWAKKLTIANLPHYGFWYTMVCTDAELLITNILNSSPVFLLYDLINKKQKPLLTSTLPDYDHAHVSPPCSYYESLVSVLDHTSNFHNDSC